MKERGHRIGVPAYPAQFENRALGLSRGPKGWRDFSLG